MWPLPTATVRELARQLRHYNAFPIFIDHYFYDDDHPLAKMLRPVVAEVAELISAMTVDEYNAFLDGLPRGYHVMTGWRPARDSAEQRERVALWSVAAIIGSESINYKDLLDSSLDGSDVVKVYPELVASFDDEGLLRIDERFTLLDGGIRYRDHILQYHQLLRRSYRSEPNFDFLGRFARYYRAMHATNSFRIAVDHRRLMPADFYKQIMELDAWYGAPFDAAKLDDPNAIGLTVVGRNPNSLFGQSNSIERTEFYWSFRDGIKTFEAEEVSTEPLQHLYLNRYVHSQRDVEKRCFIHLDGAVKAYLADQYALRRGVNVPNEPKAYRKPKLWRIDGDIALDAWSDLVCYFFRQNEMVIKYLDPAAFEEAFEERVRDFKKWKQSQGGK